MNDKLKAIALTALMVLSVFAISGYALGANVQRGAGNAQFNPGVGGPTDIGISPDKPVVFRGEDDITYLAEDGSSVDPANLIGVSGDAEGIPLESPIPEDQTLGQYAINGQATEAGVTVQQPRVTDLSLLNELASDVADSSIPEDETILVQAEWNFQNAEDLDLQVLDENGNEITGDVIAPTSELSEAQLQELNGPYAETPAAAGNPGQRGTGTEIVYLQGVGQFNQSEADATTVEDAFWVLDLSDQDAGQYTITAEGWDNLDFGPASRSATLEVTTDTDVQLDLDSDSATRGQYVPFTIRGSTAGETHFVTIEDDDFRNNNVDRRAFRDVANVLERGTYDSDDDGEADFAYAQIIIDEDTGFGQGQIDTTYLDDTNVDVNVYESGLTIEDVAAEFGNPEDDVQVRVEEGELSIAEPAGTYIAGQEVDVRGAAEPGIDDVALYARDQGDWELLDVSEDGSLDDEDLISVDADGEWEERDVRLSVATDILAIPGRYRFGVIEAEDARGADGELQSTLSTTEFSSGSSEQTSILVTEPGLGPAPSNASVADPGLNLQVQQDDNETTAQAPLVYRSYNGQVATDDGTVDVLGTAPGQDDVLLIMVDTRGRVATDQVTVDDDDIFEEDDVSLTTVNGRELNEGSIAAIAYAVGRDAVAGDGIIPGETNADISGVENYVQQFSGSGLTQQQVLEILADETIDEAGSDDLYLRDNFRYTDGSTTIESIQPAGSNATGVSEVSVGEQIVVSGVTNRKPDDNTISIDVTQGPEFTEFASESTDEWGFSGQWSVSLDVPEDIAPGSYTIEADDGDNTDIVTFEVVESQANETATPTPAPDDGNETATPTPAPDDDTETPAPGDGNETTTPAPTPAPEDGNETGTPGDVENATASVSLSSQTSDGNSLVVDEATLPDGGFVAIHDSSLLTEGNEIGSVVGTSEYLAPGTYDNVTLNGTVSVGASGTYVAMLHLDTNGNQANDYVSSGGSVDIPYSVDGRVVIAQAEITLEGGDTGTPTPAPGNETAAPEGG